MNAVCWGTLFWGGGLCYTEALGTYMEPSHALGDSFIQGPPILIINLNKKFDHVWGLIVKPS